MNSSEKRGRPFERLVAAVQAKIDSNARVQSPYNVRGGSGSLVHLDAAVFGKVGSVPVIVAIEAKDYRAKVGVEKVRAFAHVIDDIKASSGIMVSPVGFTRDALRTAENAAIDTCVLRPAKDEDWQGYLRSFNVNVVTMIPAYRDASFQLEDGQIIAVAEDGLELFTDKDGRNCFFDRMVDEAMQREPADEGKNISLTVREPLWYEDDSGAKTRVAVLHCKHEWIEGMKQSLLHDAPEDWVFVKQTLDGELAEKSFFEFKELDQLAERFRAKTHL